ncbi:phosphatidylcholine transfer protein isoform X2 [Podarcis raffonei]|uniref:phosphatidylcholine transfer protein isoform X2 n=1 Tax=Podarcis raffonei TaxID=65483 RepID=UPI0023299D00|nr:phosphatidylcholine transfer protein isoform X2 [Podarcis raffonei]
MCPPEALRALLQRRPKVLPPAKEAKGGRRRWRWWPARCLPVWSGMSRGASAGPSSSSSSSSSSSTCCSSRRAEQARGPFGEEQFLAVCRESTKPREAARAAWELMAETASFCIFRLFDEKSGLYEYKVYATLGDCSPDVCAEVYMDLTYRTQWDRYLRDISEKPFEGRTVIHWEVKFPFPMANRDYVFIRERKDMELEGKKIYVILAKSVNTSKFPEKTGIVRVKNYKQCVAFESDGKKGSKVFMSYFDDPGGKVPSWLVNWGTKTGVPNFLIDMEKACHSYRKR